MVSRPTPFRKWILFSLLSSTETYRLAASLLPRTLRLTCSRITTTTPRRRTRKNGRRSRLITSSKCEFLFSVSFRENFLTERVFHDVIQKVTHAKFLTLKNGFNSSARLLCLQSRESCDLPGLKRWDSAVAFQPRRSNPGNRQCRRVFLK